MIGRPFHLLASTLPYLAVLCATWVTYQQSYLPSRQRQFAVEARIAELQKRIALGRRSLAELEQGKPAASRVPAVPQTGNYTGPALVWFPDWVSNHFSRFGNLKPATRLNNAVPAGDLPGFQRIYWAISLPVNPMPRPLDESLIGISELERREISLTVLDMDVQSNGEEEAQQALVFNVCILVPE